LDDVLFQTENAKSSVEGLVDPGSHGLVEHGIHGSRPHHVQPGHLDVGPGGRDAIGQTRVESHLSAPRDDVLVGEAVRRKHLALEEVVGVIPLAAEGDLQRILPLLYVA